MAIRSHNRIWGFGWNVILGWGTTTAKGENIGGHYSSGPFASGGIHTSLLLDCWATAHM